MTEVVARTIASSDAALPASPVPPWTCPFCPLLCDAYTLADTGGRWQLIGSDCPKAKAALANFDSTAGAAASPLIDGQPATWGAAIDAAAAVLAPSRQPLFGGLGTDVAGARALYRLVCATGAISDAAGGAALAQSIRALQDRGAFTTTYAEVRSHCDVMVCVGGSPTERYPEFFRRCGLDAASGDAVATHAASRHIVGLGGAIEATLAKPPQRHIETIDFDAESGINDVFDAVATLAALVARRGVRDAPPALQALADRLLTASYAVIVWDAANSPPQAALLAEAINRIVSTLNRSTRAASIALGGANGASTVNQVYAWLSGLPLRSRLGALGLEHEPVAFDAERLLARGEVDSLLWVSSFQPEPAAPATTPVPTIILGHPKTPLPAKTRVFIPVSTPGIGSTGDLFRNDGVVMLPLAAVMADSLPGVAAVVTQIGERLAALRGTPA